jgi:hypothetical protein
MHKTPIRTKASIVKPALLFIFDIAAIAQTKPVNNNGTISYD